MIEYYQVFATILLFVVVLGLIKVFNGKEKIVQLLALQLLGTSTVAIILLLAQKLQLEGLRDLALIMGLLACIIAIAFVHYVNFNSENTLKK